MGDYPEKMHPDCHPTVLNDNHPVSCVSLDDVIRFAHEKSKKDNSHVYRLPSDQEWVTAAGNIEGPIYGWCNDQQTHQVKTLDPYNGLYDMVGNVYEWTSTPNRRPGWGNLIRGASFDDERDSCKASSVLTWSRPNSTIGFRLLRQP
jgi:formylglycine-generating enzyme required for sulfatase activity